MTLRETLQAEINGHQTKVAELKGLLLSVDPQVAGLMNADMAALKVFFSLFKDKLGL